MIDVVIARGLHVVAVVVWIGGVALVTTVVLPALRKGDFGEDRRTAFQAIERRFSWQARTAAVVVLASGLYMVARENLWSRYRSADFWWMHAMAALWLMYAVVLFVIEPLFVRRRFRDYSGSDPGRAYAWMQWGHLALLALSLFVVFAAVVGSRGWPIF
ncbi:MAG: DUF4149 domain-containing protein [Caulobacteraceae bacterium]